MKYFLFVSVLLICSTLFGQKVFLDKYMSPLSDSSGAVYYREYILGNEPGRYKEVTYYMNGQKALEVSFLKDSSLNRFVTDGYCLSWYENGQKSSEEFYSKGKIVGKSYQWYNNGQIKRDINYVDGTIHGELITYWRNGQLKRKDYYDNGSFVNGTCFDSLGNEVKHFNYIILPEYIGGDKRLIRDIYSQIHYPKKAFESGIEGRVVVRFAVHPDGTVANVDVIEGNNAELNHEAVRVVSNLKKFKPGYRDGEPEVIYFSLPVNFQIK